MYPTVDQVMVSTVRCGVTLWMRWLDVSETYRLSALLMSMARYIELLPNTEHLLPNNLLIERVCDKVIARLDHYNYVDWMPKARHIL